ncbi:hypothetical protein AB9Q10_46260 [Streptomyces krungchingensis]|uniref:hypothetical protein n=1 Tax=Streptomyces krungchingensis TaxID=1565034 RepID=UPI003CE68725
MEVCFTRQLRQPALLAQRGERTDKTLDDHARRLRGRSGTGRVPLPAVAALTDVGALAVSLWQSAGR